MIVMERRIVELISRDRNDNIWTNKAPFKSTRLFTSAASSQRGCALNHWCMVRWVNERRLTWFMRWRWIVVGRCGQSIGPRVNVGQWRVTRNVCIYANSCSSQNNDWMDTLARTHRQTHRSIHKQTQRHADTHRNRGRQKQRQTETSASTETVSWCPACARAHLW